MRWIESQQAILMVIKHGPDLVEKYQNYLDCDVFALFDCEEIYNLDTKEPLDFHNWLEIYVEEYADQMEWENSDEFRQLIAWEMQKDD